MIFILICFHAYKSAPEDYCSSNNVRNIDILFKFITRIVQGFILLRTCLIKQGNTYFVLSNKKLKACKACLFNSGELRCVGLGMPPPDETETADVPGKLCEVFVCGLFCADGSICQLEVNSSGLSAGDTVMVF